MSAFIDERLREAAANAEARAAKAEQTAVEALGQVSSLKKRFKEARRSLIRDTLRIFHVPPFLVVPHVAPRPRAPAPKSDRFSLLELE